MSLNEYMQVCLCEKLDHFSNLFVYNDTIVKKENTQLILYCIYGLGFYCFAERGMAVDWSSSYFKQEFLFRTCCTKYTRGPQYFNDKIVAALMLLNVSKSYYVL